MGNQGLTSTGVSLDRLRGARIRIAWSFGLRGPSRLTSNPQLIRLYSGLTIENCMEIARDFQGRPGWDRGPLAYLVGPQRNDRERAFLFSYTLL